MSDISIWIRHENLWDYGKIPNHGSNKRWDPVSAWWGYFAFLSITGHRPGITSVYQLNTKNEIGVLAFNSFPSLARKKYLVGEKKGPGGGKGVNVPVKLIYDAKGIEQNVVSRQLLAILWLHEQPIEV